jgi:hypothetical protein
LADTDFVAAHPDRVGADVSVSARRDVYGSAAGVLRCRRAVPGNCGAARVLQLGARRSGRSAFVSMVGAADLMVKARELYERALIVARDLGDPRQEAACLHNLGVAAQVHHRFDDAESLFKRSLEIEETIGNVQGASRTSSNFGMLAQSKGDARPLLSV